MLIVPLDPAPDPLGALAAVRGMGRPILLHGAGQRRDLGRHSYLMADPVATLDEQAPAWPRVADAIRATTQPRDLAASIPPFQGGWAGWLGYELAPAFDRMRVNPGAATPDVALGLHDWVISWDHLRGQAWLVSTGIDAQGVPDDGRAHARLAAVRDALATRPAGVLPVAPGATIRADFSRDAYEAAVQSVIEHVRSGDIFQANLAQRFAAAFDGDPLAIFGELVARAEPPMAAYIEHPAATVVSASPERFLQVDATSRRVESRPIKGTRPRGATPHDDARLGAALFASEKDRAENVMIVDLVRNDLARVAVRGSVQVPALCRLESHPTVHHLVSTITATLRDGADALDLVAAAFPGGSVTGAPKLRAMEVIAAHEPVARGVYCGAIGWIGLDGSMDLNIPIRTVTVAGGVASWHAGGGITARSDPAAEYDETLDKARALARAVTGMP